MTTTYDATVRHTGLAFGESPRWHAGRLWFSDFYRHGVFSLGDDGERAELTVEGQPSGFGWQPDGTMLVVSMIDRRVLAVTPDGETRVHADIAGYCGYWANDMAVGPDGTAYVGNFGFDLDTWMDDGTPTPPSATNLVVLAPDGAVRQVVDDVLFPNGTVLTEDGRTLILAETLARRLTAFDVAADGTLHDRRVFAELKGPVFPDGICLDAEGQVWVATAHSPECLRIAEGGEVTAKVVTQKTTYACMLGGDNRTTLFVITAPTSHRGIARTTLDGQIESVEVEVRGAGYP
jgi:sugar lactone lactonase YvrE